MHASSPGLVIQTLALGVEREPRPKPCHVGRLPPRRWFLFVRRVKCCALGRAAEMAPQRVRAADLAQLLFQMRTAIISSVQEDRAGRGQPTTNVQCKPAQRRTDRRAPGTRGCAPPHPRAPPLAGSQQTWPGRSCPRCARDHSAERPAPGETLLVGLALKAHVERLSAPRRPCPGRPRAWCPHRAAPGVAPRRRIAQSARPSAGPSPLAHP